MTIVSSLLSGKGVLVLAVATLLLGVCIAAVHVPTTSLERGAATDAAELLGLMDSAEPSPGGELCAVAISPDGNLLATGARDGSVRLWDTARHCPLGRWTAHEGAVTALVFFPDSRGLLSAGAEGTVTRWSVDEAKALRPAGRWKVAELVTTLAVAPDGRTVATATSDRLRLYDAERGVCLPDGEIPIPGIPLRALAFTPDGKCLAGGGGGDNAVRVWTLATGRPVLQLHLTDCAENWVRGLAYSADGCTLVSLDTAGRALAWDRAGNLRGEFRAGHAPCLSAALGVGGRLVFTTTGRAEPARLLRLPEGWWH
jgi:WD40 repeat protein